MDAFAPKRWEALDILRGLSIIFMLLSLNPGAWGQSYDWLVHAKWQGGTFIDMVAPVFLFCIGAVIPLSLRRRTEKGTCKLDLTRHILIRAGLLVLIGLFLNAYPVFDFAHLRLPGVLQRIGLSYALVSLFVLFVGGQNPVKATAIAFVAVTLGWFLWLYFVPVPGFGAPRFDPVGSWPAYIDRALFTTDHMFPYWPVDGKVVFDPDGLLSTLPVCANVLFGALTGALYPSLRRPLLTLFAGGVVLMGLAVALNSVCPIIKNIWTSTFILFTSGFAWSSLGLITVAIDHLKAAPALFPAKVYGSNALLAYVLSFLIGPLIDFNWLKPPLYSLRGLGQATFSSIMDTRLASFCFGIAVLTVLFIPLFICYRKRWFLKL
jgi:predicted acyltransferase